MRLISKAIDQFIWQDKVPDSEASEAETLSQIYIENREKNQEQDFKVGRRDGSLGRKTHEAATVGKAAYFAPGQQTALKADPIVEGSRM